MVLKPSHWYQMTSIETPLIPQTEEDIERAIWIDAEELLNLEEPMYKTIEEVVKLTI